MTYRLLAACVSLFLVAGCSTLPRIDAVPENKTAKAIIPGIGDVRYAVDSQDDMQRMAQDIAAAARKEAAWRQSRGLTTIPSSSFLALSGGGDKGAFGAGLLNGWTASGTRPEFLLVTGVSTGALIAPFAFLGSAYDAQLKDLYTNTPRQHLIERRSIFSMLNSDALLDTTPLRTLIEHYIDRAFLDAIAAEHAKGRQLWIATTNLDTRQKIVWNMTKLATYQDPRALMLFHDVMMASAAIPIAFPPIMIEVEVHGETFSEMHVDGGAMAQVFIYPPKLDIHLPLQTSENTRQRAGYIIMNEYLSPRWENTPRGILNIAGRSIDSLIQTQGIGDLFRIYLTSQRDNIDFNLTFIPSDFNHPNPGVFDNDYMRALFDRGYQLATHGEAWSQTPPGFSETHTPRALAPLP
jgi:hypothetical protein